MISVSPRLGELLTRATQTPDLETALLRVLSEYIEMKLSALNESIARFEAKWGMSFEEFAERSRSNGLGKDSHSFEVERDFWEWEQATTLREHYRALKTA